jgi:hypothetical protein
MSTSTIVMCICAVMCFALATEGARDTTHHLHSSIHEGPITESKRQLLMRMSHRASGEYTRVAFSHAAAIADVDDDLVHNAALELDRSEHIGRLDQKARRRSRRGAQGHPDRRLTKRSNRKEMVSKYAKMVAEKH